MRLTWATFHQAAILCLVSATATLTGCSSGPPTAKVTGKVTCDGKPVEGGTLTFVPVAAEGQNMTGKPGTAIIGADGTYSVSTNGNNDGAVIGKQSIRFSPAFPPFVPKEVPPGESLPPSPPPTSPYSGLFPSPDTVEIKAGSNTVNIELITKSQKK